MINRKNGRVQLLLLGVCCAYTLLILGSCKRQGPVDGWEKPEENRFTIEELAINLDEPMQMDFMPDGRILFVERKGRIRIYDTKTNKILTVGNIPVSIGYYDEDGTELQPTGEDGMQGGILDPNFETNGWIYLYYSPEGKRHHSILARYEIKNDRLVKESMRLLLDVPNQRQSCCHLGGGMIFDAEGNLYLSTGDNTPNDPRGYSPLDERRDREMYDAQRTSGNTHDLRGKILRIHPEEDGTYSIPQGNLFPEGTLGTRPEIYTMGNRNPWRLSLDSETGWLFWGEVGPAGIKDSLGMGPKSYDEFNVAKGPGNFGWPHFLADNKAFWRYDYEANEPIHEFQPNGVRNESPHNSGLKDLPDAVPAVIWYPQIRSEEFPLMGSGSNSAVGGPVFRYQDFKNASRPFPRYYEGKWFITDWTRGWIFAVTVDNEGNFVDMEPFLEKVRFNGPIDMKFGPDGDLYMLEYGRGTYKKNADARLVRIKYDAGNRPPIARINTETTAGAAPFHVSLSAAGSQDYDGDPIEFKWRLFFNEVIARSEDGESVSFNLTEEGNYQVELVASDIHGQRDTTTAVIQVGNEFPVIDIDFPDGNQTFFFPTARLPYTIAVNDAEDLKSDGGLQDDSLRVNVEYVRRGRLLLVEQDLDAGNVQDPIQKVIAAGLISKSDCQSCHLEDKTLMGPAYRDIAKKYANKALAKDQLVNAIINGSRGEWGNEVIMPPHPDMASGDAEDIVEYILNYSTPKVEQIPLNGDIYEVVGTPPEDTDMGVLIRASYTDRGSKWVGPLTAYHYMFLRNPYFPAFQMESFSGMEVIHQITQNATTIYPLKKKAYISIANVDMTFVNQLRVKLKKNQSASIVEAGAMTVRTGASHGNVIGESKQTSFSDEAFIWVDIPIIPSEGKQDVFLVVEDFTTGTPIEINGLLFSR